MIIVNPEGTRHMNKEAGKKIIEQKVVMLDKKIDDLVYKFYCLTDTRPGWIK